MISPGSTIGSRPYRCVTHVTRDISGGFGYIPCMHQQPELPEMADLLRAAGRPNPESQRLLDVLAGALWPGGASDRTERVASGWLRMWGPVQVIIDPPRCGCSQARCQICN